ncbi:MAG: 2-C-methyl-D-erythritol 4-phosphate cytidylyltransferase [Eubacterium sp.]|nr:2-C-methyl-D-erythritol 4-phosphate cytidylyltransferase [Eubacterium sp.]
MDIDNKRVTGRVAAVITAAGKGTRMNSSVNKQYMEIGGVPVLARTITVFQQCQEIDDIIVVVNEEDISHCRKAIVDKFSLTKVRSLVSGGAERQNSVYKGLCAAGTHCGIVLIHDGARPFVTDKNIVDCIEGARNHSACGIGVRLKDTVKISDPDGFVVSTPDRGKLWSIQTPQGFELNVIMEAHEQAVKDCYTGTDDMVLVERQGIPVKIIEGSYQNIKITTPEDIIIGESILTKL